jgi:hypothetical protein
MFLGILTHAHKIASVEIALGVAAMTIQITQSEVEAIIQ